MRLQRLHADASALLRGLDALCTCLRSCHCRDVADAVLDRSLSDVAVVVRRGLAGGSVDYQLDLAVGDLVRNVRSAFVDLEDLLGRDAFLRDEVVASAGGKYLEAQLVERTRYLCQLRLVAVAYRKMRSAASKCPLYSSR